MTGKKVLIVDDEDVVRDVLCRWLELDGYETCTASDGHEGLRRFHEERPDLVVNDILMPGMDGRELCQRIREASDVPIIVVSGLGNLGEEQDNIRRLTCT